MNLIPTRSDIDRLQAAMAQLPQLELPTKHHFADGMYCRELFRPADTTIVGKVHKREHLYIVLSGEVTIAGDGYHERIKAPRILMSQPGTKRAVYAHVDSICITIHNLRDLPANEAALDQIEAELVEPDETALFDAHNKPKALVHS